MSDAEYASRLRPNTLHLHPGSDGAYAKLIAEGETLVGEIEVTGRSRLAVSAFFVNEKADYGTFKITKIKYHARFGWQEDGHVHINHFDASRMRSFVSLLAALDLTEAKKEKITLDKIDLGALTSLLATSRGNDLLKELSLSPNLHNDIYAINAKRVALKRFDEMLSSDCNESEWQNFFSSNTWIFGHGLRYVFLDQVSETLETATTGHSFDRHGKRVDGLMRTRAEVSQFVLLEIKRHTTELVKSDTYRSGAWSVSSHLSGAVTQMQKSVFEFSRDRFREQLRDADGNDLGCEAYAIEPRSFLIIGSLGQLVANQDKIVSFELYRRNLRSPEIITFDELHERAKCIIENISSEAAAVD